MHAHTKAASAGPNGIAVAAKADGESFSGFSQGDAGMHANASELVQLQAPTSAQGADICAIPGAHVIGTKALQKQGRGASTFQYMDHRPEAKQAAQLQAIADNHSASVIQRKALSSTVLNVAGENHDTSGKLRKWEDEYAKEKTGGKYWQEDEFKVKVPKPGKEDETVSVFGDPKILQMANIIHLSTNALSNITRLLTELPQVKVTKSSLFINRLKVFGRCDSIKNYLPTLKAIGNAYKKLKREAQAELPNRPDLKAIYNFYSEFGDAFYDNFGAGIDLWVSNTLGLNRATANEEQVNLAAKNGIAFLPIGLKLMNDIFKKDSASFQEDQQEMKKVIFKRSQAMHDAAIVGRASKGVWKIGDTHIKDIKEILHGAPPGYALMTEDEFFADFNKWLPKYPVYQAFQYGMELADIYDWSERTVFEMAKAGHFDEMVQVRKNHKDDDPPSYIS